MRDYARIERHIFINRPRLWVLRRVWHAAAYAIAQGRAHNHAVE